MLNAQTNKVALYSKVTAQTFSEINIFDVYETIKTKYKSETLFICENFADKILSGFKDSDKTEYQNEKRNKLHAVVFSGCYDRSAKANKTDTNHSGRINFDIDNNTKHELIAFFDIIKSGKIPFIEAAALSVSGSLTGDFWLNIIADIPNNFLKVDKELIKILSLTKDNYKMQLHAAYYELFSYMLKENGIIAGKTKDLTRARYLSHDPNIYINTKAKKLRQENLISHLRKSIKPKTEKLEIDSDNIFQSDAFSFAEQFAAKEYTLTDGQKHLYLNRLAICLNALGITKHETETYLKQKGINYSTNCIDYPYKYYKNNFGKWKNKLNTITADYYLNKENTLRNYLTDIFDSHKLPYNAIFGKIWNVPTGTGKTNLVIETAKTDKVIMFVPLLNIAEQTYKTAVQRGINALLYIGDNKEKNKYINKDNYLVYEDIQFIICTYQSIDSLYRNVKNLHEYNVICDEIHTAISTPYLNEYFTKIFDRCNEFKSLSGLTGTYLKSTHPNFNKLPKISLKLRNSPKPETKIISVKNLIKAAYNRIEKSISENRKVLILLNSVNNRLTDLTKILTDSKIDFDTINSDTKDSDCYKNLIKSETLNSPVTICTSVIEMGTNIHDKNIDIITIGTHHASTIRQFSERIRNNEKRIFIIYQPNGKKKDNINNDIELKILNSQCLSKHLNNYIFEMQKQNVDVIGNVKNIIDSHSKIKNADEQKINFLYYSEISKQCEIDYFAIDNYCFNIEKTKQNSSPVDLKNALLDFGFCFDSVKIDTDKTPLSPDEILERAAIKEQKKTANENDFNAVISELKSIETDNIETAKIIITAKTKELHNDSGELIFYNQFLKLCEYSNSYKKLVTNFAATSGAKKRIKLLFSQYTHHRCEFSEKDIQHAIKTNFRAGEKIGRAELIERFINCIQPENVAMIKENFAKRVDGIFAILKQFFRIEFSDNKKNSNYEFFNLDL